MSTTLTELEAKIRTLSSEDKAQLFRALIAELDGPADTDVERAWLDEAVRRHQELMDGSVQAIPGEQVFANLRARRRGL